MEVISCDEPAVINSNMYTHLTGVIKDESSPDVNVRYQPLGVHTKNNDTMNRNNIKNNQSDAYLGPPKDAEGYLVPNKELEKALHYKNMSAGSVYSEGLQYVPPFTPTPNYLGLVEDEQPDDQKMKTLPNTMSTDTTQLRKLPEVPVRGEQFYEELTEHEGLKKKVCRCWTWRRLLIVMGIVLTMICVVIAVALIAYYTTRGNTSTATPPVSTATPPVSTATPPVSNTPIAVINSCNDPSLQSTKLSGVYTLNTSSSGSSPNSSFNVYCDMETDGGGWLVFQRRQDGSQNFYRNWADYKAGFGPLNGEFWLGNDKLHQLTMAFNVIYRLRVDLEAFNGKKVYAQYENFQIDSEATKYNITFSGYQGTAGDSLSWHYGLPFTTQDRNNGPQQTYNCAVVHVGAWWYNECFQSNLNGEYLPSATPANDKGINWYQFTLDYTPLKFTEMKMKLLN